MSWYHYLYAMHHRRDVADHACDLDGMFQSRATDNDYKTPAPAVARATHTVHMHVSSDARDRSLYPNANLYACPLITEPIGEYGVERRRLARLDLESAWIPATQLNIPCSDSVYICEQGNIRERDREWVRVGVPGRGDFRILLPTTFQACHVVAEDAGVGENSNVVSVRISRPHGISSSLYAFLANGKWPLILHTARRSYACHFRMGVTMTVVRLFVAEGQGLPDVGTVGCLMIRAPTTLEEVTQWANRLPMKEDKDAKTDGEEDEQACHHEVPTVEFKIVGQVLRLSMRLDEEEHDSEPFLASGSLCRDRTPFTFSPLTHAWSAEVTLASLLAPYSRVFQIPVPEGHYCNVSSLVTTLNDSLVRGKCPFEFAVDTRNKEKLRVCRTSRMLHPVLKIARRRKSPKRGTWMLKRAEGKDSAAAVNCELSWVGRVILVLSSSSSSSTAASCLAKAVVVRDIRDRLDVLCLSDETEGCLSKQTTTIFVGTTKDEQDPPFDVVCFNACLAKRLGLRVGESTRSGREEGGEAATFPLATFLRPWPFLFLGADRDWDLLECSTRLVSSSSSRHRSIRVWAMLPLSSDERTYTSNAAMPVSLSPRGGLHACNIMISLFNPDGSVYESEGVDHDLLLRVHYT